MVNDCLKLGIDRIKNLAKNAIAVFVIHINFDGVAMFHKVGGRFTTFNGLI